MHSDFQWDFHFTSSEQNDRMLEVAQHTNRNQAFRGHFRIRLELFKPLKVYLRPSHAVDVRKAPFKRKRSKEGYISTLVLQLSAPP